MRYLGLDYGARTLGVSISDETGTIASTLKTIRYNDDSELLFELDKIIKEFNIKEVVLGLPLNMNGTNSVRGAETYSFKTKIEKNLKVKVHLQDERLSTVEAEKILIGSHIRRNNRKKVIDSMAAVIILQTFLDKGSGKYEYNYDWK